MTVLWKNPQINQIVNRENSKIQKRSKEKDNAQ